VNRVSAIKKIIKENSKAVFLISNGLSAREANFYLKNDKSFYMLHAMGETLSVGMGMAEANKNLRIVVIDGDYNALMGSASWHNLTKFKNLKYYVLKNRISQTTGSQKLPSLFIMNKLSKYINVLKISDKKTKTPNPENPIVIKNNFKEWLKLNNKI